jgi:hypothetical protein
MANYNAAARSNYFKVKDAEAFKAEMAAITGIVVWEGQSEVRKGMFAVASDDPDTGCWPSYYYDEELDDDVDVDLFGMVAEHLEEGQVAVFMEAGAEKLRYVSGYAVAVNWEGEQVYVSLNDIYNLAKEKFGVMPDDASY